MRAGCSINPAYRPMTNATTSSGKRGNKVLRTIAILKFIEAAAVVAAGLAALQLLDPATLAAIAKWTQARPGHAEQHFAQRALDHLSGITPRELKQLGAGAFAFAGIFLAEAIGLWMERPWAEWLAVVATSLFIPLEVLELFKHVTVPKLIALVLNVLVVGYLIIRIRNDKRARRLESEGPH